MIWRAMQLSGAPLVAPLRDNRLNAQWISFNPETSKLSWMTEKGEHFTLKLEPAHIALLVDHLAKYMAESQT
jgi:hypothetical protein